MKSYHLFLLHCELRLFLSCSVLRIRDVYPGSGFIHPRSWVKEGTGFQIRKTELTKNLTHIYIYVWNNNLNCYLTVLSSRKHDPWCLSRILDPNFFLPQISDPDSESRGQKGTGFRTPDATLLMFDFQPLSRFSFLSEIRIPNPGVKKALDPGLLGRKMLMFDLMNLVGFSACGNTSISFKFTTKQTEGLLLYQVGSHRKQPLFWILPFPSMFNHRVHIGVEMK